MYAFSPMGSALYLDQILNWMYYLNSTGYDETGQTLPNAATVGLSVLYMGMVPFFYFPCGSSPALQGLKDNPLLFQVQALPSSQTPPVSPPATPPVTPIIDLQALGVIIGVAAVGALGLVAFIDYKKRGIFHKSNTRRPATSSALLQKFRRKSRAPDYAGENLPPE
jgi:hypothetical protein